MGLNPHAVGKPELVQLVETNSNELRSKEHQQRRNQVIQRQPLLPLARDGYVADDFSGNSSAPAADAVVRSSRRAIATVREFEVGSRSGARPPVSSDGYVADDFDSNGVTSMQVQVQVSWCNHLEGQRWKNSKLALDLEHDCPCRVTPLQIIIS